MGQKPCLGRRLGLSYSCQNKALRRKTTAKQKHGYRLRSREGVWGLRKLKVAWSSALGY